MHQYPKGGQVLLLLRPNGQKTPALVINSISGKTLICRISLLKRPQQGTILIGYFAWEEASQKTRAFDWYVEPLTLEMLDSLIVVMEIGKLARHKFYEVLRGLDRILFGALEWRRRRKPGEYF